MRSTIAALALAGVSALPAAAHAQVPGTAAGPASASDPAAADANVATTAPVLAPEGADSTTGLADIVVTAQRREESLQKVPVAVTALSSETLSDLRVVNAQALSGLAPSLTINTQGVASNPTIIIRGISSGVSNNGVDPKIATYVDGVYIGRVVGSLFDLADIQRIEVLRGPQGTLFGRNATGGALSITTATPKGEFGVRGTVSYGNYDARRAKISVDLPSFGPFSARFSYLHDQIDGDVRNLIGGQTLDLRPRAPEFGVQRYARKLGSRNVDAFQVAVRGEFGAVTADYRFDFTDANAAGRPVQAFGVPDDATAPLVNAIQAFQPAFGGVTNQSPTRPDTYANATSIEHIRTQGHSLTLTAGNDNGLNVKSISAYRKFKQDPFIFDLGGTGGIRFTTAQLQNLLIGNVAGITAPANLPRGPSDQLFTLLTARATSQEQYSQEFQVQYQGDRVELITGVFIFHENSPGTEVLGILQPVNNGVVVTGAGLIPGVPIVGQLPFDLNGDGVVNQLDFNPSLDATFGSGVTRTRSINDSFAGYAQGTLHVTDTIDLTAGGRYTFDDRKSIISAVSGGQGGQLGLGTYNLGYEKFTYALIASWKPTQELNAYAKLSTGYVAGGIISGIPYRPETLKTYEVGFKGQFFNNRLRTNIAAFYAKYDDLQIQNFVNGKQTFENAGKANIKGIEVEVDAVPFEGLTFNGNLSWTDLTYKEFLGTDTVGNRIDIADIARRVYAPTYQGRASLQYDFPAFDNGAHLFARVDGTYRSKISLTSPAYVAPNPNNPAQVANAATLNGFTVQPKLFLLNGRAGLVDFDMGGGKMSLSVFGQNLTNKKYVAFGAPVLRLVAARERGRTYGVELGVQF